MADTGGSQTSAFGLGVNHQVNPGRANTGSITLNDTGLDQTSQQAATTPHGVLATTMGAASQDDGSFERYQRTSGSYAPGSMTQLQDQISNGSNDNLS